MLGTISNYSDQFKRCRILKTFNVGYYHIQIPFVYINSLRIEYGLM